MLLRLGHFGHGGLLAGQAPLRGRASADVAHYMLSILDQPETFRRTVGIAN